MMQLAAIDLGVEQAAKTILARCFHLAGVIAPGKIAADLAEVFKALTPEDAKTLRLSLISYGGGASSCTKIVNDGYSMAFGSEAKTRTHPWIFAVSAVIGIATVGGIATYLKNR